MNAMPLKCVAVMGPTAAGKSGLGIDLAVRLDGEVVSMDSRQVYRGMDIGTGKVTREEMRGVAHHLLDVLDPDEAGNAGDHARLAREAIAAIDGRGRAVFLVGGTGLYFDALLDPFIDVEIPRERLEQIRSEFEAESTEALYRRLEKADPDRAHQLSRNDRMRITRALEVFEATGAPMSRYFAAQSGRQRPGIESAKIVLTMPRETLRSRIEERTRRMYASGWVEEVRRLLAAGYTPESPGLSSLGYREIAAAIQSGEDPHATLESVITRTQQYAKRQETWFRRERGALRMDVTRPDQTLEAARAAARFLHREKYLT